MVWSKEKAWDWYNSKPWFRGCNYLPSDCCNRIAMWQELDFEKHLETMDRELALAASIGFNSIRVILEYIVYKEEHDSFMERFERFLTVAAKHGITVMVCFGNDCTVPKDSKYKAPYIGVQTYDLGYHGGRKNSPHGSNPNAVGYSLLDEPESAKIFFNMVEEFVSKYKNDERICIWDLFNEPGNANRDTISVPHVQRMFDIARSCNPIQPLTSGVWTNPSNPKPAEVTAMENSDIISFHSYWKLPVSVCFIEELKEWGRPLIITEWLHRCVYNTVEEMFPLFYLEKIGCWNWGFVAGPSQTYEPWELTWACYEKGQEVDVTRWQHDLFRPSLRPYDPKEIEIIRKFTARADEKFAAKK